jgi:hypothetical protein
MKIEREIEQRETERERYRRKKILSNNFTKEVEIKKGF